MDDNDDDDDDDHHHCETTATPGHIALVVTMTVSLGESDV